MIYSIITINPSYEVVTHTFNSLGEKYRSDIHNYIISNKLPYIQVMHSTIYSDLKRYFIYKYFNENLDLISPRPSLQIPQHEVDNWLVQQTHRLKLSHIK